MILILKRDNLNEEGQRILDANPQFGIHSIRKEHLYLGLLAAFTIADGVILRHGFEYSVLKAGDWIAEPLVKDLMGLTTTIMVIQDGEKLTGGKLRPLELKQEGQQPHHHEGPREHHER
jgi:hypothetical protein